MMDQIGEENFYKVIQMIDLRFVTNKQIKKFNLEVQESYGMTFLKIKGTDFWVLGIDEETNTIYAQMDYGKVDWDHIKWLADVDYHIAGVLTQHIPGLYDTREYEDCDKESLYDSACDFVDDETVFIIKKGGENL